MRERVGVILAIFERLAKREFEMQAVFDGKIVALERALHDFNFWIAEAERLEVGEAPPRVAEVKISFDRAPVCRDRAFALASGLQRMPVGKPDLRLPRMFARQCLVDFDRGLVFADPAQHRRFEIAITGMYGVVAQQAFELLQRFGRMIRAM